jgi:gluconolactonase
VAVEILDEAMLRIAPPDRAAEELGSGYGGPHGPVEGPIWIHEGACLLFSDIHGSRRYKWHPTEGITLHKDGTANANGMTRDRQGRLVVCHHISRCVDREEADGSITVVADRYHGLRFNRPNDVVVRSDGSIYFTDPPPRLPLTPPDHHAELDIAGVYRVSPDLARVNMIIRSFVNPNGLCFSPDEKVLYINDSNLGRKLIMAYDVETNGFPDLGTERLFCDMRGDSRPGAPDGMKVDIEGNVYCTGPGGIWVLNPAGKHLGTILSGGANRPINMNWGDNDWSTLYFTGLTTLNRIRLGIPGMPVPRLQAI